MAIVNSERKTRKQLDSAFLAINTILHEIYTNKSSDEYKMKGDITKSPSYSSIEKSVAELNTLKGYDKKDAADLHQMFTTLHLPVFKTMVREYMVEPNDRNTLFATLFTTGYRFLVGELARIFSATEATPKGIIYKPDKNSRKESAAKLIHLYNSDIEKRVDEYIREINRVEKSDTKTEAATLEALGIDSEVIQEALGLSAAAAKLGAATAKIAGFSGDLLLIAGSMAIIAGLFHSLYGLFKGLNPVADINYLFMNSYDKKIAAYNSTAAMYAETKRAYEEYINQPMNKQDKRVVAKYQKAMEKHNIKMKNLEAQIEHYNSRAKKESEEFVKSVGDAASKAGQKPEPAPAEKPASGENNSTDDGGDDIQF